MGLTGIASIFLGLGHLSRGEAFYTNWFNELVFAPMAFVVGIVMILFAIFKAEAGDSELRRGKRRRTDSFR